MSENQIYEGRGVSSSKSEIHQAIQGVDPGLFPGAFCKILPDHLTQDKDSCLLMHADGAGTKSSLAYLYWKETGDLSVFKGIAQDSLVMNLDDLACVGAVTGFVLSNTIGRNKFHIPGEVVQAIIWGYEELLTELADFGVIIHSCGGETADVGDLVRTLIVDSTLMVKLPKKQVIDLGAMRPQGVIVGFASYGQAKWEKTYNSGIGGNGLTAARHDSLTHEYAGQYPESFAPEIPPDLVYCGKRNLTEPLAGTPLNWGQAILSPTRTYTPLIKAILEEFRPAVQGFVHCSGGGQTKCLKFGQNIHYVKNALLPIPPLFTAIRKDRALHLQEMFPVFNMGHRLEAFIEESAADGVIALARSMGIEAQVIGHLEPNATGNQVTIQHQGEQWVWR